MIMIQKPSVKNTFKTLSILYLLLFFSNYVSGQQQLSYKETSRIADSLYKAKHYGQATYYYLQQAAGSDFVFQKAGSLYNAACCLSLQGKKDSALFILKESIKSGYADKAHLLKDSDLNSLHSETDWNAIVKNLQVPKKSLNTDPTKTRFITEDIHHFWMAYEKALQDTLHFKSIFKMEYFDKGSRGMQDYMALKVSSIDQFIEHIKSAPRFYGAIKNNTLQVDNFKPAFFSSFKKFKSIYPPALFPDVYFIIGAFTSGGTVSDAGLLIGLNQSNQSDEVPVDEISFRLRTIMNPIKYMPNIIAHELIHFQQNGMKNDTITLGYAIREGMADFIGELISGSTANPALFEWAKGKEKTIWGKFTKDMYYDRYNNWIANSKDVTEDNLPDQGYWVGYQICKAYYEKAANKKIALAEMLNIKDYKAFLQRSGWETKLAEMK